MLTRVVSKASFDFLCCKYCANFKEIPPYSVSKPDFSRKL